MSLRLGTGIGPLGSAGMVGLRGASSLIESMQYGTVALGGSTSATATITAVDLNRSILIDLRQSNNWSGGTQPAYTSTDLALSNSTTITAVRQAVGGITCTAAFCVIQFRPGILKSVQSGTVTSTGTTTATITAVNPNKAFVLSLGLSGDSGGRDDYFYGYLALTDATTVTLTRGASGGSAMRAGWLVGELF